MGASLCVPGCHLGHVLKYMGAAVVPGQQEGLAIATPAHGAAPCERRAHALRAPSLPRRGDFRRNLRRTPLH